MQGARSNELISMRMGNALTFFILCAHSGVRTDSEHSVADRSFWSSYLYCFAASDKSPKDGNKVPGEGFFAIV